MFIRKAGKYLNMLYVFYFSFFIVLYFFLFKDYGFANEVYSFDSIFSGFKNINFLASAAILLYFVEMVAVVKFLVNYFGKRESFSFYLFYIFSSLSGFVFYLFFFAIIYLSLKRLILKLKAISLTEIPVLVIYLLIIIFVLILWKIVTYWKIKARLNYFGKFPGLRFLILPLNRFNLKGFIKFLLFVSIIVGLPFVIFIFGILNKSELLIFLAVVLTYILYPFSKLYVYYLLIEKREI